MNDITAPDEAKPLKKKPDILIVAMMAISSFLIGGWVANRLIQQGPGRLIRTDSSFGWTFEVYSRMGTGLQRADDVAFFSNGQRLAMTCPRYTKMTLWAAPAKPGSVPQPLKEIDLEGRPLRLVPYQDNVIVLQRPPGDDRHIKPAFIEVFSAEGEKVAGPVEIGWEPDDLALVERDGRLYGLILLSGNAEGEDNRPNGSVNVVEIDPKSFQMKEISAAEIPDVKKLNQDPLRIVAGRFKTENQAEKHLAMVTLGRQGAVRRLDWTDPTKLQWGEAISLPDGAEPVGAALDATGKYLVTADSKSGQAIALALNDADPTKKMPAVLDSLKISGLGTVAGMFHDLQVAVVSEDASKFGVLGADYFIFQKLKGPYGFGSVRAMAVATYQADENTLLMAICDRTGGLHWAICRKQ